MTALLIDDAPSTLPNSEGALFSSEENNPVRREFEEEVKLHTVRFRLFARRWIKNPEDAEDLVQDALLKAHTKLHQFEGRAKMSTWLTVILINTVRMHLRTRPRITLVSAEGKFADADGLSLEDFLPDSKPLPDREVECRELYSLVQGYMAHLSPRRQQVMKLFCEDGFTTKEIQGKLNLANGTVRANIARSRKRLKQLALR
jgi:RNA polymerase sigma-70 factor (ECF subfamily)